MKHLLALLFTLSSILSFGQQAGFEPYQLIVQIENNTSIQELSRNFESENHIGIKNIEALSPLAGIYLLEFNQANEDIYQIKKLIADQKGLIHVQFNHYITSRETIPTDTLFSQQWFHKNTGQTGGNVDADIDTPEAWDITTGGLTTHNDTIVVCIIEGSGVDISHIDLVDNIWHNYAEIPNDGIDNDNNGYTDDFDGWNVATLDDAVGSGSHGTRVAGMIGATGNNVTGVSGVNWDVKMMIVKGQVASNEASVIAAYNYPLVMRKKYNDTYGQEGAFVVATNASWGIDNGQAADAPIWCAMYDTLGTYGILNVAATTNSNSNVDLVGDLPTTCTSEYLIGVTMTNSQDLRAGSGYGPTHIDLAAPGFGVTLTTSGNLYNTTNGTSFASPCVAGAIALAYSTPCPEYINYVKHDPSGAALDMRSYILSTTDVLPVLFGEVATSGRLNAYNCVDSILTACSGSTCISPYNLRSLNITDTTASFEWDGFSGDYLFYIQEGANAAIEIPTSSFDTIAFDTLIPCTNYSIWVRSICGTDTSANSYSLNFQTDGCCNNPDFILDYASADTIILSWEDILYATEYDIRYRKNGETTWISTYTDTIYPITFSGLDTCTEYEFQIKTICTDSTHGFSPSTVFSTKGCGACYEQTYCDVSGVNSNFEWIEEIKIGNSIYTSGDNNGWLQSANLLHGFYPGTVYSSTITAGYSGNVFSERFTLWVDYNQNGVFEDGEKLIDDVSGTSSITTDISVPISSVYGVTKLRVGMLYGDEPSNCPSGSLTGEYEDYCVYIGPLASLQEQNNFDFTIYPNPASNQIQILSIANIIELKIFTLEGKLVKNIKNPSNSIDVSEMNPGLYLIEVATENSKKTKKLILN